MPLKEDVQTLGIQFASSVVAMKRKMDMTVSNRLAFAACLGRLPHKKFKHLHTPKEKLTIKQKVKIADFYKISKPQLYRRDRNSLHESSPLFSGFFQAALST